MISNLSLDVITNYTYDLKEVSNEIETIINELDYKALAQVGKQWSVIAQQVGQEHKPYVWDLALKIHQSAITPLAKQAQSYQLACALYSIAAQLPISVSMHNMTEIFTLDCLWITSKQIGDFVFSRALKSHADKIAPLIQQQWLKTYEKEIKKADNWAVLRKNAVILFIYSQNHPQITPEMETKFKKLEKQMQEQEAGLNSFLKAYPMFMNIFYKF